MKNKFIAAVVLIVGLLVVSFFYSRYRVAPTIYFSTLQLTDLNNNPVKLDSYKGKKLFINFFATWCGPCVREMPQLESTQNLLQQDNFVFICISDEPVERLQNFATRTHNQLIILHSEKNLHELSILTIPTSYVIASNGETCFKKVGEREWNSDWSVAELRRETK